MRSDALSWAGVVLTVCVVASPAAPAAEPDDALLDPRSGQRVGLPRGERLTHVVFFATWCPPCLDEFDELADLGERWSDRGYELVLVAVQTRQTAERIARFVDQQTTPGATLFDVDGTLERHFRASRLPTHLLLDAGGAEVFRADRVEAVGPALERQLSGARPRR